MKINSYFLSSDFKCRRSQRDFELRKSVASCHSRDLLSYAFHFQKVEGNGIPGSQGYHARTA